MEAATGGQPCEGGLVHDALLYRDLDEFAVGTAAFVRGGLEAGEPVLVAVPEPRHDALREQLGDAAREVSVVDMRELGRNPGRILPAIAGFVDAHAGRRVRFVGEPSWAGRRRCEAIEAARHEALINVALADADAWVLCPYDVSALSEEALVDARRTHPWIVCDGRRWANDAYEDPLHVHAAADRPLPEPGAPLTSVPLPGELRSVRSIVRAHAVAVGLPEPRVSDLLVAVTEAAANAKVHGRPPATLTVWNDRDELVCDVQDAGWIRDPLAGRVTPTFEATDGRGIWLMHRLCDLVELRSGSDGTMVRLRVARA